MAKYALTWTLKDCETDIVIKADDDIELRDSLMDAIEADDDHVSIEDGLYFDTLCNYLGYFPMADEF